MVQQHRIYVVQFDKGEPDQEELSCKASPPKGGGRRIMYYYHDYGTGGAAGKNGKPAKSRALSLSGFFGLLLICLFGLATLLAAPGAFFSFARTGGAAAAAAATQQQQSEKCSGIGNDTLCCDRSSRRADMCFARGDLRMHSASASFQLVSSAGRPAVEEEERIRPYTRKWEAHVMKTIDEVRFHRVSPGEAARCDVRHDMPAVLLSTGGFTGNVYHEFNDGLLPMFVTAGHLQRRVVFVILEYHDWWMTKYGDVVSRLSAFPPIDFTADRRVHCFPEVIAGLRIHGELTVDPARTPEGRSIRDFRRLLDDAYRPRINYLERMERKAARKQRRASGAAAGKLALPSKHPAAPAERPKLVIVSRTGSRVIENEEELKAVAADVGFDVRVVRPERSTEMCKIYRDLNASDAMVGVHGAAMTHFLFMRPGKVFIQVVPLGTDWAANEYYGEPAARLGLRYVGYKILPEESSLAREYPAGHPVLTDPAGVAQRGWDVTKKVYLDRQNVRLDLARFREELVAAHRYLVAGKRKGRPKTKPIAM
ncbi:xylan glycosyltransferase MUCI21 [Aegilops tauschii subsp. strangulata]|uniref:Glycosyltransferase 61 catalytic domain-containing protein n=2 Tax=Triticinae TaxID=1648030 RepID=A0A453AUK9_AEGTS|nr:xylan glycosyltransferase MUCI21 [Aegilops tauschii subsp. strangulata]XP_044330667.1 xylan glycosyltransferase MUCI21-like [Triticum aestivum]